MDGEYPFGKENGSISFCRSKNVIVILRPDVRENLYFGDFFACDEKKRVHCIGFSNSGSFSTKIKIRTQRGNFGHHKYIDRSEGIVRSSNTLEEK